MDNDNIAFVSAGTQLSVFLAHRFRRCVLLAICPEPSIHQFHALCVRYVRSRTQPHSRLELKDRILPLDRIHGFRHEPAKAIPQETIRTFLLGTHDPPVDRGLEVREFVRIASLNVELIVLAHPVTLSSITSWKE
jgi:hypothetical protein